MGALKNQRVDRRSPIGGVRPHQASFRLEIGVMGERSAWLLRSVVSVAQREWQRHGRPGASGSDGGSGIAAALARAVVQPVGARVAALATLPDAAANELAGDPEIFQREGHYAIRINDEITVDVMPAACGHGWQELSAYVTRMDLGGGVTARVLSLEGLLLTKEGLRDKDRADRAVLLRALGRSE